MTVTIVGPRSDDSLFTSIAINTTSRSLTWSRGLSPFLCGPIKLYGKFVSKNIENAWQYSKVYSQMADEDGNPTEEYWRWAQEGWGSSRARRYPLGRKAPVPLYSLWDGQRLGYIEARVRIYCPLYADAVEGTEAFKILSSLYSKWGRITLWDFDGYDHRQRGMTYRDALLDGTRSMGHSFVLAMMLENERVWEEDGLLLSLKERSLF